MPDEAVPAVRPSDAERDEAVAELKAHCADGRLTLDEFGDRVSTALLARSHGELREVTADLPASSSTLTATAGERPSTRATTHVIGIMSGGVRKGRWRPGQEIKAFAFWGGCHIDLRGAEFTGPEMRISAVAIMGGIEVVVPEGVKIEVEGLPLMGGIDRRVRDVPALPGMPTVRVKAFAFWGGVCVRSKPSRSNEQRALGTKERRGPHHGSWHHDKGNLERVAEAVQHEQPDLTADAMPDGTVTILFSDIEGFTALTERLGDLRAQEVLRAHNELVRAQVAACGGHEVKAQGDSFMVSFAGARRGLRCAIGIQRAVAEWSAKHPDTPLHVRIGLHTGEAIREEDDLFGRSVIMAARIAAQAEGDVILVSSLLKELAEASGEFRFGLPHTVELKGLAGEHVVYPVEWE